MPRTSFSCIVILTFGFLSVNNLHQPLPLDEQTLSSVLGGDVACEDCYHNNTGVCIINTCTGKDEIFISKVGTNNTQMYCGAIKKGGGLDCRVDTPKACWKEYECFLPDCQNCTLKGQAPVNTNCQLWGTRCP